MDKDKLQIQKVKNYIPIITPEKFFIDNKGQPNSFCDCNPAIYIDRNQVIKILVRHVNYRKFSNKTFVLGNDKSLSEYVLMTGTDLYDLNTFTSISVKYDWNDFPKYDSWWEGMEDIRFITDKDLLITVPDRNPGGMPCLFLGELNNNIIKLIKRLDPHNIEKNWMPYHYNNEVNVIYSVSPFIIKSLEIDDRKNIALPSTISDSLENYHGSSNGISYKNEILFLVHKYTHKTEHRWIKYNPDTNTIVLSDPFVFFEHSYIEFTCNISWYNNDIVVSLGVNDNKSYICVLSFSCIPI